MIMNIVGGRPGEECILHLLVEDPRLLLPMLAVKEGHRFLTTSVIVEAGVAIGEIAFEENLSSLDQITGNITENHILTLMGELQSKRNQ